MFHITILSTKYPQKENKLRIVTSIFCWWWSQSEKNSEIKPPLAVWYENFPRCTNWMTIVYLIFFSLKITASSWNCWDSTWPSWPPDPTEIGLRRQKPRFVFNQLGFPVKLQVNKTGSWKIGVHGLVIELEYRGQYVDSVAGKVHIFWKGHKS